MHHTGVYISTLCCHSDAGPRYIQLLRPITHGASCLAWSHVTVGICSHSVGFALQGNKEVKRDRLCAICECSRCRQCHERLGRQHLSGALAAHLAGQKSPCPCRTSRKGKLRCYGVAHVKRVVGIPSNPDSHYPCQGISV